MKKIVCVLAACLAVFLMTGCRSSSSSTPEPLSGSTSSSSAAEPAFDTAAFDRLMSAIAGYQPGTAGSSLKLYVAACELLNFSEEYDNSFADEFRSELDTYLADADEITLMSITDGYSSVEATAQEIVTQGTDAMSEILEEAGSPNLYDSYDAGKFEEVASILSDAISDLS